MKILLVGEFSRLHNSLKEGLTTLGHEVTLIGDGDLFKNYPVDISLKPNFINSNWFLRKFKAGFYKFTKIDLGRTEANLRFLAHRKKLKAFDVVQFIHADALKLSFSFQYKQIQFLHKHNKQLFLLCCGNDYPVVEFLLQDPLPYHILTPYFHDKNVDKKAFHYPLIYASKEYKAYYQKAEKFFTAIIPTDIDYVLAIKSLEKAQPLIPTPINLEKLAYNPQDASGKIHIFLGINASNRLKKGIGFFEEALDVIKKKYPNRVAISVVENIPYQEYVKRYQTCHIFLDMVYAYDQGYNALEAMAQGKVVFTGAEKEFLEHYALQEDEVCINALPDVAYLVKKLSWLIENPEKIMVIGKNARKFVKKEHDYLTIAKKYEEVWRR